MHGCLPFRAYPSLASPPFVARFRSMRSSSVAEAAALAAVRYARLADEKNKRRRNVERQKELVDIAGGERESARKERAERIGGESGRQKERRMQLMWSRRKREKEGEGENDRTKDGVPRERGERRNRDESSRLTWATRLDLNNRSRSAFEIALAPVNTFLRVRARADQTERSSLHKNPKWMERDARHDNAVKYIRPC